MDLTKYINSILAAEEIYSFQNTQEQYEAYVIISDIDIWIEYDKGFVSLVTSPHGYYKSTRNIYEAMKKENTLSTTFLTMNHICKLIKTAENIDILDI